LRAEMLDQVDQAIADIRRLRPPKKQKRREAASTTSRRAEQKGSGAMLARGQSGHRFLRRITSTSDPKRTFAPSISAL
jgi:hypothetical protein